MIIIDLVISFLIGWKHSVNFANKHLWHHLAADYKIIMSRTLKVTDNHVIYDCGTWFLRVFMSNSRDLCCLLSAKGQKHDFHFFVQCIIKQLLDSVFVIYRIIKVLVSWKLITLPQPWLFWITQKPQPIIIVENNLFGQPPLEIGKKTKVS